MPSFLHRPRSTGPSATGRRSLRHRPGKRADNHFGCSRKAAVKLNVFARRRSTEAFPRALEALRLQTTLDSVLPRFLSPTDGQRETNAAEHQAEETDQRQ